MSYNTQGSYPQAATKRDTIGIGGLEARVDECMTKIGSIQENLHQLQARLYPPRPEPVKPPYNDGSIAGSIENSLNRVINALEDVRALSQELIHG